MTVSSRGREQVTGIVTAFDGHPSRAIGVSGHQTDRRGVGMREEWAWESFCAAAPTGDAGVGGEGRGCSHDGGGQACTTKQEAHGRRGSGTKGGVSSSYELRSTGAGSGLNARAARGEAEGAERV